MRSLVLLRTLIATKLGACAFCIRLSLLLSISSWAVFAAFSLLMPGSLVAKVALFPALGFATLFGSHLAAYVIRVVLAYRKAEHTAADAAAPASGRRRFVVLSAQTIGLALVPTLLASKVFGSLAQSPNCPFPPGCDPTLNPCCCDHCKTLFKKCDPRYAQCSGTCAAPCVRFP